ncbi:unnamed protein product [Polarella glacialis]|uniref:RING-type domain-containing protein n=1 Tax=Polarella glacialis TaxID=89957 RepID=A0A813E3Z3_POLGL|nr:unnamed protein product [Polarella glacialis]CAE8692815.1 unnamed protein product [Polarella glacialis]
MPPLPRLSRLSTRPSSLILDDDATNSQNQTTTNNNTNSQTQTTTSNNSNSQKQQQQQQTAKSREECCVCLMASSERTPCGHLLCSHCWSALKQPLCPMCRRELGRVVNVLELDSSEGRPESPRSRFLSTVGSCRAWRQQGARSRTMPALPLTRQGSMSAVIFPTAVLASPPHSPLSSLTRHSSSSAVGSPGSFTNDAVMSLPSAQSPWVSPIMSSSSMPSSPTSRAIGPPSRVRAAELLSRIGRASLGDVSRLTRHVAWLWEESLITAADGTTLCRAVRRRAADVFSRLPLHSLTRAGDLLEEFASQTDRCPAFGGGDGSPRKALESRISFLVYHPSTPEDNGRDSLESLAECYRQSLVLAGRGVVSNWPAELASNHVARWVEQAPLALIHRRAVTLRLLAGETMPQLVSVLSDRLRRLSPQRFDAGQLMGFALVLADLQGLGLTMLDGALEERLVQQLREGVETWPGERLYAELCPQGTLLALCRSSSRVRSAVEAALPARMARAVAETLASLRSSEDSGRVKQELTEWGLMARVARAEGLLDSFGEPERRAMLNMLSDYSSKCMASSSPALRQCAQDIDSAQWSLLVMTAQVDSR